MPRRKRRSKKKKRSHKRRDANQLKFRTGNVAPAGRGKPFIPQTKTYNARCVTTIINSATTSGDIACFFPGQYNLPLSVASSNEAFTFEGTVAESSAKHPTGHAEAIAQGYDTAEVLSCLYRFTIRFQGADAATKDFCFAYKFTNDLDVDDEVAFTAGVLSVDQWHNMQMTRAWTWKRFSATQSGGSIWPSSGIVNVNIPSVAKLMYGMNRDLIPPDNKFPLRSVIADTATISTFELPLALAFCVFTTNGIALAAADIIIEIDWFGKVRLARDIGDEAIIENLDHGT